MDNSLPSLCANCDTVLMKPLWCGDCKQVYYCGTSCQTEHWQKGGHANMCPTMSNLSVGVHTLPITKGGKGNQPKRTEPTKAESYKQWWQQSATRSSPPPGWDSARSPQHMDEDDDEDDDSLSSPPPTWSYKDYYAFEMQVEGEPRVNDGYGQYIPQVHTLYYYDSDAAVLDFFKPLLEKLRNNPDPDATLTLDIQRILKPISPAQEVPWDFDFNPPSPSENDSNDKENDD